MNMSRIIGLNLSPNLLQNGNFCASHFKLLLSIAAAVLVVRPIPQNRNNKPGGEERVLKLRISRVRNRHRALLSLVRSSLPRADAVCRRRAFGGAM